MAFHEVRFPADIALGASAGPAFSTSVVVTSGGHEKRSINWSGPLRRYNVSHGIRGQSDFDLLLAFFHARQGRAHGFRFKDWQDYRITNQVLATTDGVTDRYRIFKRYGSGGVDFDRPIKKLVAGALSVTLDDVDQAGNFTADLDTGIIDFSISGSPAATAPAGQVLRVTAEFDVPVRFDGDVMRASEPKPQGHAWPNITLVEIRV